MNANDVRVGRNLARRRFQLDTELRCSFRSQTPAPRDDRHPKRVRPWNHLLSDLSEADQSERATKQSARFRKLFLVPLATSQRDHVVGNTTIDREYQRESKFGHCDRILARTIRNVNAALRSGGDVDRVV